MQWLLSLHLKLPPSNCNRLETEMTTNGSNNKDSKIDDDDWDDDDDDDDQ